MRLGEEIIIFLCNKINKDDELCYDSTIVRYLRDLTIKEVYEIINFIEQGGQS